MYLLSVEGEPDIVRLLDDAMNDAHQGLLHTISEDDLLNTDIYVFRESSGELLAERSDLAAAEVLRDDTRNTGNIGLVDDMVHYRIQLRGKHEGRFRVGSYFKSIDEDGKFVGSTQAFERWQVESSMNPKFYQRQNHLYYAKRDDITLFSL